jgi:carboxyl-terminal processing protease
VVVAVDGLPVEEALMALSPLLRNGSSPQHRRANAAFNLLSTTTDSMVVTLSGPDGDRTVTLTWPEQSGSSSTATTSGGSRGPTIQGWELGSGLGVIHIPHFGSDELVYEFDAALDDLMGAPGIILDLRGNGGGDSAVADQIAGRFLSEAFTYGREFYRARLPQRGWRPWFDYRVKPRGETYTGQLVLLTDAKTFSTTETFVVALVDSGRAATVGRRTGGGSGNPIRFEVSGGARARFSTGDFRRNGPLNSDEPRTEVGTGPRIEGNGIAPEVPVSWTVEAFRAGEDLDVAAAEALILDR